MLIFCHTNGLSPSTGSTNSVFSPLLILSRISNAEYLCKYSLLFPHLYEKVHRGHPASFLQGHSFTICILLSSAFSNLSYNALLAPLPPMAPSYMKIKPDVPSDILKDIAIKLNDGKELTELEEAIDSFRRVDIQGLRIQLATKPVSQSNTVSEANNQNAVSEIIELKEKLKLRKRAIRNENRQKWAKGERPVTARELAEINKDVILNDPFSRNSLLWKGWNAFSGSGDVTAEVVYANYGRKEDFEKVSEKFKDDYEDARSTVKKKSENFFGQLEHLLKSLFRILFKIIGLIIVFVAFMGCIGWFLSFFLVSVFGMSNSFINS